MMRQSSRIPTFQLWTDHLLAWLDRRREDMIEGITALGALKIRDDPEAMFQEGWLLCDVGEYELGLGYLQRAVAKGYFPTATLTRSPQFDALRGSPAFDALLAESEVWPPPRARRVPRRRRRTAARRMKTLARQRDRDEILSRLARIHPGSTRRWGTMSAHEMVCHLSDAFRMATGAKLVSPAGGRIQRTITKWVALTRRYRGRPGS